MHDLKQIAKDAERVEASAKAWLSECEGLDRDEIEYHESERRLAAFVADLTDETPATPEDCHRYGIDAYRALSGETVAQFGDNEHHQFRVTIRTRGQLFALAMGLTLREGGR